jgi:hypothetical protein
MKPRYYILISVALFLPLVIAAVVWMRPGSNQRRLTLLVHGVPEASIPVMETVTGIPRRTDEYGTITYPLDDTTERAIFYINADRWRTVPVPEKGHAIVNFFHRYSIRKTIVYEPGAWFPTETITEEFYLADEELAAIKAKRITREEVENHYRKHAQAFMDPEE